jgi:LysM repeat protein
MKKLIFLLMLMGIAQNATAGLEIQQITVSPLNTTTYTVNATDTNGCIGTATYNVTVNSLPSINAGVDQTICAGGSVTLSASGGNTGSYVWSSSINNNQVFTPSTTATYTVTGTDSNGCSNTDQVIVTVNPIPLNPTVTSSSITYCQNQSVNALTASGNSLKWYTTPTSGTGSSIAPTPSTTIVGTTTYYVSQTVSGCESGRTPINVIINSLPINQFYFHYYLLVQILLVYQV